MRHIKISLCLAAVLAAFSWPSLAHLYVNGYGEEIDASWIMQNPETNWCCGPQDCFPAGGLIHWSPAGWEVDGLKGVLPEGSRGLFHRSTPDGRPWACKRRDNTIRCLIFDFRS